MSFWVYMVRCSDGFYYVGSHRGEDPAARVGQHNAGFDPKAFTYARRPVELVWCEEFQMALDMIAFERRLKGWSRAKKEALIRGDWNAVQRLARSPTLRQAQDEAIEKGDAQPDVLSGDHP